MYAEVRRIVRWNVQERKSYFGYYVEFHPHRVSRARINARYVLDKPVLNQDDGSSSSATLLIRI